MIHLDSSFTVDLIRENARKAPGPAAAWLEAHHQQGLVVSVFVACELEAGAAGAAHPERERTRVRDLLQAVSIVYPEERFAAHYAELLARMQSEI